jgi:hypothetical protein
MIISAVCILSVVLSEVERIDPFPIPLVILGGKYDIFQVGVLFHLFYYRQKHNRIMREHYSCPNRAFTNLKYVYNTKSNLDIPNRDFFR